MDAVTVQRFSGPAEERARVLDAYALRQSRAQGEGSGVLSSARNEAAATRWAPVEEPGPAGEVVLTNARVVMRDSMFCGTVHVVGGRIADIDAKRSSVSSATDLDGDFLIPGLVDIHTDNLERHLEPRPGVAWPSFAALVSHDRQIAAAGVTTVFDSLCIGDQRRGRARCQDALVKSLQAMEQAQADGLLKAEHFLHLRCEVSADDVVETFETMVDDPFVRLVSVMDHTPGQRQWRDIDRWRQFHLVGNMSSAELNAIYERRTSRDAEIAASARGDVARMCRDRGLVLASHDDTTAEHIAEAAAEGVTISEFPTTAVAARLARSAGMQVVMGAPNVVLGGSHSGNVSARELAAEGLVDGLASDYVPVSLIQACLLLHEAMGMAMPAAVATVTAKPAAMIGLADRGEIAPGLRADLVWVKAYDHMPVVRGVWRGGRRVI
jgi:alpha-D-ribose 1-methylphosphonate 5-triphosphate diphosphatase